MVRYNNSLVLFGGFYDTGYEVGAAPLLRICVGTHDLIFAGQLFQRSLHLRPGQAGAVSALTHYFRFQFTVARVAAGLAQNW
jgi:hypothetical protein